MTSARRLYRAGALLLAVACIGQARAESEGSPVFDRGEKYDLEKGHVYKEKKKKEASKGRDSKTIKTINYHIKNLKDPDPEVRQSSAEMLGVLGIVDAVPYLIEVLNPARKEPLSVLLSTNGALVQITAQNFGYKQYQEWLGWWTKNKDEFLKKAESGVDERAKIAAGAANTLGRELMRMGQFNAAQQQFTVAVDKDPTVPDYRNNLGLAILEQGKYLDAMEHFEEILGLNPELPQPYMNIGRCYSRMGKSIEAQAWYKKALDRDKDGKLWDLQWMIGKEYMKRHEFTMAFEYLDQARVKAEKNTLHDPQLYNDLAITHYGMDQYHSAWKEITNIRAIGFEPNADFVAKVRKALADAGIDPDKEDKEARDVLRAAAAAEENQ